MDIEYMYLVVDLMNGGDLRFHITRKAFTEEAVRFWISELGLALRYIHSHGIIHRDIKPDNVLLDAEGHVHLADFNVACDFIPGKLLTGKSGTMAYLAPEVLSGKGYSCGADWWSLGVLFYECIYNKRPFEKHSCASLKAQIIEAKPKFPVTNPPVSIVCMHAISSALEVDVSKRMGSTPGDGFTSFTDNPFFRSIDFEALERKEIEPVFVPSSEKINFDASYDLEELLLEEAPLEARARRQKPREQLKEDASEKEIREYELYKMIDEHFTAFDYTTASFKKYIGAVRADGGKEQLSEPLASPYNHKTSNSTGSSQSLKSRSRSYSKLRSPALSGSPTISQWPMANCSQSSMNQDTINSKINTPANHGNSFVSHNKDHCQQTSTACGNVQTILGESRSWPKEVQHDTTLPPEAKPYVIERSTSIFSLFSRRKNSGHNVKPRERGVLGKEGARVIISKG